MRDAGITALGFAADILVREGGTAIPPPGNGLASVNEGAHTPPEQVNKLVLLSLPAVKMPPVGAPTFASAPYMP